MTAINPILTALLEDCRHALVTYQGLFASDLHWQDRLPHLENGTQVEFQIDDTDLLARLAAVLDATNSPVEGTTP